MSTEQQNKPDQLEPVGELTIIWDREKREILERLDKLESQVAEIARVTLPMEKGAREGGLISTRED